MKLFKLSQSQMIGIIRHVLTFIGGILVTDGTINSTTENQIIGSLMALIGLIWSIVTKNNPTPPTPLSGTTS
jgi:hypothetical protein